VRRERGYKRNRLIRADAVSGSARNVIDESSDNAIDVGLSWSSPIARTLLDDTFALWYSQADGWGHIYLHDLNEEGSVRQLTCGPYEVAELCHIDEQARRVYFLASGREPERDPYFHHLYGVSLDGGEPVLLTPDEADHRVSFSPDGRCFIDTYSRVDSPPVHALRASDGQLIAELERTTTDDLLATGWQLPERFRAKARDGTTDVYGVILRPSTFDPQTAYPVIDYVYAGPQVNQAPASFADSSRGRGDGFWHAQAIAELGFVVVMIDGLGMPGRSKAYHDVTYRDLGDGGMADHIAAIRQLGDRYPYLDLDRVGIYGHSAGGYASAHAIFSFPDFFKVCVSSAGNHDHRLDKASWVERYMGLPVEDHYREQANQTIAQQLKGKLLLIHGEMDENVHVASTLVVVDALIKANKDFDLLIMPNRPHGCGNDPYFIRRRWDYFVRHLLGATPPAGYRIEPDDRPG
jgi:dipeptidyl aminopeptidase/acylaminoacyl peptidase